MTLYQKALALSTSIILFAGLTSVSGDAHIAEEMSLREGHPENMYEYLQDWFPSWFMPHYGDTGGNPHAIDRGHLVDHDFREEFWQIVDENGFNYDNYTVQTDDGYILVAHRIRNEKLQKGAPVVFL